MNTPLLVFGLILTTAGLAQQPQQSAAPAPQADQASAKKPGIIAGSVVNAKTNQPVRRVNLTVRPFGGPGTGSMGSGPMTPAAPYSATTDAEGKFRIENVDPGSYRMSAERQGFVRQEYGARLNSMMGTTVTVAPAQELKDLNFKLIPHAVITGRVVDEEGEPLAHVQVQVLGQRYFRGKRQLMPTGGGQTNDTGEFRVADLPPVNEVAAVEDRQAGKIGKSRGDEVIIVADTEHAGVRVEARQHRVSKFAGFRDGPVGVAPTIVEPVKARGSERQAGDNRDHWVRILTRVERSRSFMCSSSGPSIPLALAGKCAAGSPLAP